MSLKQFALLGISLILWACQPKQPESQQTVSHLPTFQNEGHKQVYQMVQKVGDYRALLDRKDVVYTYIYQTADGRKDVSTEKYLFDGELSYGLYEQHERTLSQLEGAFEQGFDGEEYWFKHQGEIQTDEALLKRTAFNRPTNFYWFAMFPKMLDPGLVYEDLGEQTIDSTLYRVVKVGFESTPDKPTDIYQLYINVETQLVDQFLFTVADFGVMEEPYLMRVAYEEVDGMLIPSERKYKKSTWEAIVTEGPWTHVNWTNISFDNGLTKADFSK